MTFANIAERPSDDWFVTTTLPYSEQNAASNTCADDDERRYKMETASVGITFDLGIIDLVMLTCV